MEQSQYTLLLFNIIFSKAGFQYIFPASFPVKKQIEGLLNMEISGFFSVLSSLLLSYNSSIKYIHPIKTVNVPIHVAKPAK